MYRNCEIIGCNYLKIGADSKLKLINKDFLKCRNVVSLIENQHCELVEIIPIKYFTMFLEDIPTRLNFEYEVDRNKKSTTIKSIRNILDVMAKPMSSKDVKTAFVRATLSFILLSEMGQMAYVFIIYPLFLFAF